MKKSRLLIASLLILLALLSLFPGIGIYRNIQKKHSATPVVSTASRPSPTPLNPPATPHPFAAPGEIAFQAVTPAPLAHPEDRSPIADTLNAPDRTIGQDLRVIFDLLEHYRGLYGGLPTGEDNAQVVNALTGNNPQRLAFISRNHPAIDPQGRLTDRWGTPFFFHFLSSQSVEIRSAGPDQSLYTPDDGLFKKP